MKDLKDLYVIRNGGYGDYLVMATTFPYLLKKYRITLETNLRGLELFGFDSRLKGVVFVEPNCINIQDRDRVIFKRWDKVSEEYGCDHEILNFIGSLEYTCMIPNEFHPDFNLSRDEKAIRYDNDIFQSAFKAAKVPFPEDFVHTNGIRFLPEENIIVQRWKSGNEQWFNILVCLGGSGINKVFPTWMPQFCKRLVKNFPKMKMWLLGDSDCKDDVWTSERTVDLVKGSSKYNVPFRQVLLMSKYSNYVLGAETGILVGAGGFGTPKTTLCTMINKSQLVRYDRNDYSVQSKCECSPCYTLAYSGKKCPKEPIWNLFPKCTHEFDLDEIWANIEGQYKIWANGNST